MINRMATLLGRRRREATPPAKRVSASGDELVRQVDSLFMQMINVADSVERQVGAIQGGHHDN